MALKRPNGDERKAIVEALCHVSPSTPSYYSFDGFLTFYNATCSSKTNDGVLAIDAPALQSHQHLLDLATVLRNRPALKRAEFEMLAFPHASQPDRERATRIAARVSFLIDCSSKDDYAEGYRLSDGFPVKWKPSQPFLDFLRSTFVASKKPNRAWSAHIMGRGKALKGWKLKKRYGLRFVPTNDLVQHLMYDPHSRSLKIFHQTTWLKTHLQHSANLSLDEDFENSVKHGTLPPRLLLETLLSIYHILFPVSTDTKSAKFAASLVQKSGFDPQFIIDDGVIREIPEHFDYIFWGHRLKQLDTIISKPPPANKVISWMERHTSERNALTIAIVGVFLAALFGFLGFAVGAAQLVVAIKALDQQSGCAC
ncbi:hypothetical protein QBC47DRAFT_380507 [Echria macrotheca]|uniref:Uncharacterized protein n=1 Tax=Echria macrotheca TaxID=438768 RepID=A0AAJ0BGJ7_9PEZI|nr:hypothetical protein QBC47DRAFT_380507 [Echria macrotheca]